jgi:hypothetical protein
MYECPWCDRKAFSFWEKQTLGPSRSLRCVECKRKVGVPSDRAQIAAAPLFLLGFLGLLIGKAYFGTWPAVLLGGWLGITLGFSIAAPIYHLFVPLERQT